MHCRGRHVRIRTRKVIPPTLEPCIGETLEPFPRRPPPEGGASGVNPEGGPSGVNLRGEVDLRNGQSAEVLGVEKVVSARPGDWLGADEF